MSNVGVVRTSRAAQAGFILGLLSLVLAFLAIALNQPILVFVVPVLVLFALIFGFRGRARVRASNGQLRGSKLAAFGLWATIPAVLLMLLLPST